MFCVHCGAAATPGAQYCAKCGRSVTDSPPAQKKSGGHGWIGLLVLGLLALIVVAMASGGGSSGSGSSSSHSAAGRDASCSIGEVRAVRGSKEGSILAAFSKKALDDFHSAAVAHDNEGIDQMVNAGELTELPTGDRLRVLDFQGLLAQETKARVLTDPDPATRGQLVWIDGCSPPLGPKLG